MGRHGPGRFDRDSGDPPRIAAGENRPVAGRCQAKPSGRRRDRPAIPGASAGARDRSRIVTTETQVDVLEAKGLIRLVALRPELEYLFRHGLVQDAAYTSLLKQERRELHGRVGVALEELYPDRIGELAPVLAMHFEHAGDAERAIEYYLAGARHALSQYAIQEAYAAFNRAAELIETQDGDGSVEVAPAEVGRRRRRRIEVELGRADAGGYFRAPKETFEALEGIVGPGEELGDMELIGRVHTLIALGRLQAGEPATAPLVKRSLGRISEVGKAVGDPSLLSLPIALVGLSNVFGGDVRKGVAQLEETLPLLEGRQDTVGPAFARGALAIGYGYLGEFVKADAAAAQATALAGKSDLIAQLDAMIAESLVRSIKGDLEGAVPLARQCVDQSEETGATACMLASSWILGDAFYRQGKYAEARDVLKRGTDVAAIAIGLELGLRPHVARIERAWGEALRAAGNVGEAEPHLQGAASLFAEL